MVELTPTELDALRTEIVELKAKVAKLEAENNRLRGERSAVCSCARGCRSREEMRVAHGTPDDFLKVLERAFEDGMITFDQAQQANLRYRKEYADMPERTVADR